MAAFGEPLHALGAVVERGRTRDDQHEAGEATGVDVVDELAQRVEGLVAGVRAYPLQGFHLVEDEQQAGVAAVAQHGEQGLQEAHRGEVAQGGTRPVPREAVDDRRPCMCRSAT